MTYERPDSVGDWCYPGSHPCVVPGARVGDYCFVGMGAALSGDHQHETYRPLAGNPASAKKCLSPWTLYFTQEALRYAPMRPSRETRAAGVDTNPPD